VFSGFMVNAWVVGTIVATVAGVVGFFVVLRGSSFAAHAIPNGAFAGAAGAYWLGFNTLVGLGVFAALAAVVIGSRSASSRRDVATALALVMMLALGALFLSLSGGYEPEIYSLLFGEILGVSTTELLPVVAVSVACIAAVTLLYRPLLLSSSVPDIAEARGVRARPMEITFLLVVAAATTVTVPVVGALLIFSLMIGPPAAARTFVARPLPAIAFSVGLALFTAWAAIASSYLSDWPVGFFVGVYSAACFVVSRVSVGLRRRQGARPRPVLSAAEEQGVVGAPA
jgi:zinc/manganese transport system permease protein